MATNPVLKISDYMVAEAAFGAAFGPEKLVNIKCCKAGQPCLKLQILWGTYCKTRNHCVTDANAELQAVKDYVADRGAKAIFASTGRKPLMALLKWLRMSPK